MRLPLLALALTGCATITPLQTASVVPRGAWRVGGQLSAAAFCGDIPQGILGLSRCTEYPDGFPLPEARVNARYGLLSRFDVGLSMQALGQVLAPERPFQLGLTADLKGELLHVATGPVTHILALGVLGGTAVAGRLGLPLWSQVEWGIPLWYGLQVGPVELVANIGLAQRFTFSPNAAPSSSAVKVNFALGVFKRDPSGIGVQLSYLTDPARFTSGALQLQVGLFFDIVPRSPG